MPERVESTKDELERALWSALGEVKDPEMPMVSLADLGMVHKVVVEGGRAAVELIPTFVGCPALDFMRRQVVERLSLVEGVDGVEVHFVFDEPWTSSRITAEGRERLAMAGIAPPPRTFSPEHAPNCSYCGASETDVVSLFGPTACRSIYYCRKCRQPFEGMKFV